MGSKAIALALHGMGLVRLGNVKGGRTKLMWWGVRTVDKIFEYIQYTPPHKFCPLMPTPNPDLLKK